MIAPIPKPRPRKAEKAEQRREHARATAELRERVMARAGGRCEACGRATPFLILDHWLSGAGRRRQRQSVETCWALCGWPVRESCDQRRTHNAPTAAYWNARFAEHCRRYGYEPIAHIEKRGAP